MTCHSDQWRLESSIPMLLLSFRSYSKLSSNISTHILFVQETAISVFYPREDMVDQGYTTFGYMKMQMVVAHGGRCAERIVFGDDITDGGRDDLEKITRVCEIL